MTTRLAGLLVGAMLSVSCAALQAEHQRQMANQAAMRAQGAAMQTQRDEQWRSANCNYDAAYTQGFNDHRSDAPMSIGELAGCPPDRLPKVHEGYRDGYSKGLDSDRSGGINIDMESGSVRVGNNGGESPGGKDEAAQPNPKAFHCQTTALGKGFSGFGPTRVEAHSATLASCTADFHEMYCARISCQENR